MSNDDSNISLEKTIDSNPYSYLLHLDSHSLDQKKNYAIPLPVSEREKFSFLQKRIFKLEEENKELRE